MRGFHSCHFQQLHIPTSLLATIAFQGCWWHSDDLHGQVLSGIAQYLVFSLAFPSITLLHSQHGQFQLASFFPLLGITHWLCGISTLPPRKGTHRYFPFSFMICTHYILIDDIWLWVLNLTFLFLVPYLCWYFMTNCNLLFSSFMSRSESVLGYQPRLYSPPQISQQACEHKTGLKISLTFFRYLAAGSTPDRREEALLHPGYPTFNIQCVGKVWFSFVSWNTRSCEISGFWL